MDLAQIDYVKAAKSMTALYCRLLPDIQGLPEDFSAIRQDLLAQAGTTFMAMAYAAKQGKHDAAWQLYAHLMQQMHTDDAENMFRLYQFTTETDGVVCRPYADFFHEMTLGMPPALRLLMSDERIICVSGRWASFYRDMAETFLTQIAAVLDSGKFGGKQDNDWLRLECDAQTPDEWRLVMMRRMVCNLLFSNGYFGKRMDVNFAAFILSEYAKRNYAPAHRNPVRFVLAGICGLHESIPYPARHADMWFEQVAVPVVLSLLQKMPSDEEKAAWLDTLVDYAPLYREHRLPVSTGRDFTLLSGAEHLLFTLLNHPSAGAVALPEQSRLYQLYRQWAESGLLDESVFIKPNESACADFSEKEALELERFIGQTLKNPQTYRS